MNNRLALFSQAAKSFARTNPRPSRKLYTRHIYPYPFNYINTKCYPKIYAYRETYPTPWWYCNEQIVGTWGMRLFWTYVIYNLYQDPGAIIGHNWFPDPNLWTDEELGIPPDSAGPYKDWVAKQVSEE